MSRDDGGVDGEWYICLNCEAVYDMSCDLNPKTCPDCGGVMAVSNPPSSLESEG